jgi:hypothetical protein
MSFFGDLEKKIYGEKTINFFNVKIGNVGFEFSLPTHLSRSLAEQKASIFKDEETEFFNRLLYLMIYSTISIDGTSVKELIDSKEVENMEKISENILSIFNSVPMNAIGEILIKYNNYIRENSILIDNILIENSISVSELLNKKAEVVEDKKEE